MTAPAIDQKSALRKIRVATLLLPPAGLWLLWRSRAVRLGRKLFGTLGILLYAAVYGVLVVLALMRFAGLELEWRGGFPPVLTFRKTKPDYVAVETHRAHQTNAVVVAPFLPTNTPPPYWTDFRGPRRDGVYSERPLLTNWPTGGLKPLWRQPIGGGYASFVVANGLAFTIEQRREREAVTAYDSATGREVWAHSYPAVFDDDFHMGGEGPRATPTSHDGRLYALGARGDFFCFAAQDGRILWQTNILTENNAANLMYGMAAAPLVVDGKVILLPGHSVVAYDAVTGRRTWRALDDQAAYMSPMVVTLAGRRQLLVVMATRAVGLDLADGRLLWEFAWKVSYDNNIAQPVLVGTNRLVLSAGYGTGAVCVEVKESPNGFAATEIWRNRNLKNKFTSSVLHEGHIYGLDEDILVCLDAATGERKWKDGRYGYGQLLLADGHLVILGGDGELALVQASPEHRIEVARFPALRGKTWNHPAIADGRLFVRNAVEMACFDLRAEASQR
jgi:outer membrane protein assembly factor BamB